MYVEMFKYLQISKIPLKFVSFLCLLLFQKIIKSNFLAFSAANVWMISLKSNLRSTSLPMAIITKGVQSVSSASYLI